MRSCDLTLGASQQAITLLNKHFASGAAPSLRSVPGRVNLIGEHIDYHDLPVLPMAIQRRIRIAYRRRHDLNVRAVSNGHYGQREFAMQAHLDPGPSGDWVNYLKAGARAASPRWSLSRGIDLAITSDLPPAAGLSSSSALLTAFTIALLEANGISPNVEELMSILPEAEHFVGTRGGGMDHAAILASRQGYALLVRFEPLELSPIPIPAGWRFLIAHSLTTAEKSGAIRSEYNARRVAGSSALKKLGFASYKSAIENSQLSDLASAGARGSLNDSELRCFLHVTSEALRVEQAVAALRKADAAGFGQLLFASHASLRDQLRVSSPPLDYLVELARGAGAFGARLTGAGFGGCAIILCNASNCDRIQSELVNRYYSKHSNFNPEEHLILAEPSAGALVG